MRSARKYSEISTEEHEHGARSHAVLQPFLPKFCICGWRPFAEVLDEPVGVREPEEVFCQQAWHNHQAAAITALHLADFLADVQAHEQVLLQRLRDLETRAVLHALDAGMEVSVEAASHGMEDPAHTFPPVDLATIPPFEEYHI
jgi:hypothetical protein